MYAWVFESVWLDRTHVVVNPLGLFRWFARELRRRPRLFSQIESKELLFVVFQELVCSCFLLFLQILRVCLDWSVVVAQLVRSPPCWLCGLVICESCGAIATVVVVCSTQDCYNFRSCCYPWVILVRRVIIVIARSDHPVSNTLSVFVGAVVLVVWVLPIPPQD